MPAPRDHEVILKDLLDRGLAYMAKDQKGNPKPAVRWPGTLDLAHQRGLVGTETEILQMPLEENGDRAVVRAIAYFERDGTKLRFTGIGTCSPTNAGGVGKIYPLEMAETRSLTRALKQGINIGNLSYADELPDDADDGPPARTVNRDTGEVTPAPARAKPNQRETLAGLRELAGILTPVPDTLTDVAAVAEMETLAARKAGEKHFTLLVDEAQKLVDAFGVNRANDIPGDDATLGAVYKVLHSFRKDYAQRAAATAQGAQ